MKNKYVPCLLYIARIRRGSQPQGENRMVWAGTEYEALCAGDEIFADGITVEVEFVLNGLVNYYLGGEALGYPIQF